VHPVILATFAAFIFAIPFEAFGMGEEAGYFTIAKAIGYAFFLTTLLQPRLCYRRPSWAITCLMLYGLAVFLRGLLVADGLQAELLVREISLLQMLALAWVGSNLLRFPRVVTLMLGTLATACSLLAVLQLTGITAAAYHGNEARMAVFGENPNTTGAVFTLGALSLLGLMYGRRESRMALPLLYLPLVGLMALVIVNTGSRGAMLALVVGVLVLEVARLTRRNVLRNILLLLLVLGGLLVMATRSEAVRARWTAAVQQRDLANREFIYPRALEMISERPWIGWGPVANYTELGRRMLMPTCDPHNLVLWLLTEVGFFGALPYLLALGGALLRAWRARHSAEGVMPMAMLLTLLVINMNLTWQNRKLHWLILAYALAVVVTKPRAHAPQPAERW
jgi:O-antigen ligase